MKSVTLYCKRGSCFHFGRYAPDSDTALSESDEIMHSDTLFAALVNTWQDIFSDANELVKAFEDGKVKISSLFPCIQQNGNFVWFLPKPISFNLFDSNNYKNYRSIEYISKKVWESIQNPPDLSGSQQYIQIGRKEVNGRGTVGRRVFILDKDEINIPGETTGNLVQSLAVVNKETLPKVRVRDTEEERGIFQLTVTEICDNSDVAEDILVHYYFLLDCNEDNALYQNLKLVLDMLPYTGIGAERSTIGKIEKVEVNEWNIYMNDADQHMNCTVSLFSPMHSDLNKLVYFKSIMRGGRRLGKNEGQGQYLKTVRMISEGAIIQKSAEGQLADVSPGADKSYLRLGKAICLPVRSKWIPDYED
ncbi:type III-A CRISPR-associated RAMP protein Csm4 [Parafilimonas terrae]|uniref:CRISPR system Cms protein Csm4 n=1 Tax=Parafilimonas terrae TaxID=1465490 RepID=A0A1I5TJC1_9BACT|nr:type III-A CRISPR-associated RAMP protein Csm4 [Parafilimonas terrae]SFP83150.1 CRISPR type III-A/MTUBE-associated RAMP protein Csm4 [Parafilimonas terrae]